MVEIIATLGAKALDVALGKIADRLGEQLEPHLISIDSKLMEIDKKIDQELLTHLRAGILSLEVKDWKSARQHLLEAVAAEPLAAVAKFLYSIVLFHEGEIQAARKQLTDALALNPSLGNGFFDLEDVFSFDVPSSSWEVVLNNRSLTNTLPSTWWQRVFAVWWSSQRPFRSFAAAESISTVAGNPLVLWRVGSDLLSRYERFLTLFDAANGVPLWSQKVSGNLHLVSPRLIVIEELGGRLEIRRIDDGKIVSTMSATYYETVLNPENKEFIENLALSRAHHTFSDAPAAQDKLWIINKDRGFVAEMTMKSTPWEETASVHDPFGGTHMTLNVTNKWDINTLAPTANLPPSTVVSCDSKIKRLH